MTKNETEQKDVTPKAYGQKLTIYHAGSTGNGAALQLEPRVNRKESDRYNCFFLEMAQQKTAASRNGNEKIPASFDWEHKLTVKLDFIDICELLAVLEGRLDKAGGQKNGIFHQNGKACTIIGLQKNAEKGGFFLGLSRKENDTGKLTRISMALGESEAVGIRSIFQVGLFFITFHRHLFPDAA